MEKSNLKKEVAKISHFLDLFCEYIGKRPFARVESINFVPTAAGLASSASALQPWPLTVADALKLDMTRQELSTLPDEVQALAPAASSAVLLNGL